MHENETYTSAERSSPKYRTYTRVMVWFCFMAVFGVVAVFFMSGSENLNGTGHTETPAPAPTPSDQQAGSAQQNTTLWANIPIGVYVSAAIVAIYALLLWPNWFTDDAGRRTHIVCDSIYFLGFIFTLSALGLAFLDYSHRVNVLGENAIDTFPVLLGYAGMALVTTVTGVFFRVLHRMKYSPDLIDEDIGIENSPSEGSDGAHVVGIAHPHPHPWPWPWPCMAAQWPCMAAQGSAANSSELTAAIDALRNDFEAFKIEVLGAADGGAVNVADHVIDALNDLVARAEQLKEALGQMHSLSSALGGKSFQKHKATIDKAIGPVDTMLSELRTFLDKLQAPSENQPGDTKPEADGKTSS